MHTSTFPFENVKSTNKSYKIKFSKALCYFSIDRSVNNIMFNNTGKFTQQNASPMCILLLIYGAIENFIEVSFYIHSELYFGIFRHFIHFNPELYKSTNPFILKRRYTTQVRIYIYMKYIQKFNIQFFPFFRKNVLL